MKHKIFNTEHRPNQTGVNSIFFFLTSEIDVIVTEGNRVQGSANSKMPKVKSRKSVSVVILNCM